MHRQRRTANQRLQQGNRDNTPEFGPKSAWKTATQAAENHGEAVSPGIRHVGTDCAVLRIGGEVDVYTAPQLRERVIHLLADGTRHIIADLRKVDFLHSTCLGALVGSLKRLHDQDGSLTLVTAYKILTIFRLIVLVHVFALHPSFPDRCRRQAGRISEIFGMLDDAPTGDHDGRIGLCREALTLMNAEEAASPAAGWLEFVAGKALMNRAGRVRVADLTAAIGSFQAALATWTPEGQPANWAAAHVNLGVAYYDRHVLTGSLEDEERAFRALDVAVRMINPEHDPAAQPPVPRWLVTQGQQPAAICDQRAMRTRSTPTCLK